VDKRDISIERNFGEIVEIDNNLTFTINIKNKITGEPFHGTLSQPMLFIASNTNLTINPVSTVLISHGVGRVTVTPKIKGNTYIAINMGTANIGGISINIQ
jgi:hypothetical protein